MERTKIILLIFFYLALLSGKIYTQAVPQWYSNYNGTGNSNDFPAALVSDANGNIYITGKSTNASGNYDYATIKLNSAGEIKWAVNFNSPINNIDIARDIVYDKNGYVFVTGYSLYSTVSGTDAVTFKYDTNGTLYGGIYFNDSLNGVDAAYSMAIDDFGNIYICGISLDNFLVVKYSNDLSQIWYHTYAGAGNNIDFASNIVLDRKGHLYIGGEINSGNPTFLDFGIQKYDTNGTLLWTRTWNGSDNRDDHLASIAVDSIGNVAATGYSYLNTARFDLVTVKYDTAGQLLWQEQRHDNVNNLYGAKIICDRTGNTYVGGRATNSNTIYLTTRYDPTGNVLSTAYSSVSGTSGTISDMTLDPFGGIYVTGRLGSSLTIILYDTTLVQKQIINVGLAAGTSEEYPKIILDKDYNLLNAGGRLMGAGNYDYYIIKYSQGPLGIQQISTIANDYYLFQNYPNPFNPVTNIKYMISRAGMVELTVYDITGSEVRKLVNQFQNTGTYTVDLNASDLPSGIYFYRLKTGKFEETKKLVLIK